jgi:hypothetical protein
VERNSAACRDSSNDWPWAFHYLGTGTPLAGHSPTDPNLRRPSLHGRFIAIGRAYSGPQAVTSRPKGRAAASPDYGFNRVLHGLLQ